LTVGVSTIKWVNPHSPDFSDGCGMTRKKGRFREEKRDLVPREADRKKNLAPKSKTGRKRLEVEPKGQRRKHTPKEA